VDIYDCLAQSHLDDWRVSHFNLMENPSALRMSGLSTGNPIRPVIREPSSLEKAAVDNASSCFWPLKFRAGALTIPSSRFDSCVHMSEEAANATRAVPYGILMSIGSCWLFGWILCIVIAACMSPDLEHTLGSPFGQPMAQIYYDALGKHGALGMMALLMIVQFLVSFRHADGERHANLFDQMGISILVAASRQSWAFSRDGALPFSRFFRPISKTFGYIPLRTTIGCAFLAAILGLLCLIAPAAASALFSLAVAGNNLAWGIPIFSRVVWGQKKFTPGPVYTGRASVPIAWAAIIFLVFGIILCMFPVGGGHSSFTV